MGHNVQKASIELRSLVRHGQTEMNSQSFLAKSLSNIEKMKNLYPIGIIVWCGLSFLSIGLVNQTAIWVSEISLLINLLILFCCSTLLFLGIYKILLASVLFNHQENRHFNSIATAYSLFGIVGLSSGLYYFGLPIIEGELFDKSIALSILLILGIMIIKGFILFPKSIRRIDPN